MDTHNRNLLYFFNDPQSCLVNPNSSYFIQFHISFYYDPASLLAAAAAAQTNDQNLRLQVSNYYVRN